MITDYESFLHVAKDGRIWWLRADAIRLGAGFLPLCDNSGQPELQLKAPNQRALVNEKTLIGALDNAHLTIPKPMTSERDGLHYVDATGFLEWLSQYICQKQAKIEFPNELANRVRIAVAKAETERPPPEPHTFESLTHALEGLFDKDLDELPAALRQRVEKDFSPNLWDMLTSDQRRSMALRWDAQNDPELKGQREAAWEKEIVGWDYWSEVPKLTAKEFCILNHLHDPRNFEIDHNSIPGGIGKTLGERVSDKLRIIDRTLGSGVEKPIGEWVSWAQQQSWDIPAYLRCFVDAPDAEPKPIGHLNHDPKMQERAIEIAAEQKENKKRSVTRNEVAKLLAKELNMNETTVLRRIRKKW